MTDEIANAAADYALSPMQKGMLFHQLFEPDSGADLEQMVLRFREAVDLKNFSQAWEAAAGRHEVLRTSFPPSGDSEPRQRVHPTAPMEIVEIDQTAYNLRQADARLRRFLAADRRRGFDPEQAPLSRLTLFRRGPASTVVVWSFHHIILDGRSFPIVLSDVFAAYDALMAGRPVELEPSIPYRDFIERLETMDTEASDAYWRSTLEGFRAPTPLVVDGIGGLTGAESGFGEIKAFLDEPTTRALEAFATESGVTLNTTLQGVWALILSIYSNEADVVFGATRSGRYGTIEGSETMAGLFINTLPMRVTVSPEADVVSWLQEIRAQHLALRDFEHTPLVDVQALSEIRSGTRLFDSILVFETYQLDPNMRARTGTHDRVDYELLEQTNHPLLLSVYGGDRLELRLEYDRSLFDSAVIERMTGHVAALLHSMATIPEARVCDLEYLTEAERRIVTEGWNGMRRATPRADIVGRWRAQVAASGSHVAVVGPDEQLTYDELDARSDLVARHLLQQGAGPGRFVAVLLDRSVEATVAILGVLKSGAAYLPLDPGYPVDRLTHMITDSNVGIVISDAKRIASSEFSALLQRLDGVAELAIDDLEPLVDAPAPPASVDPEAGAYIIYTSGSTGTPKGVVVSHDAVVNHADGVGAAYGLQSQDRILQFAALSFDVAAEELFPSWLAGAAVVLRSNEIAADFDELERFVDQHRITVMNLPAAFWSTWVDHLSGLADVVLPSSLRLVVTGSEKVSTAHYERWRSLVGHSVRWLNAYGPTEATITASVFDPVGADVAPGAVMPIGRPIDNTAFLVLDQRGKPTPIGVAGELHIGGRGLAIGYHERPELTAEKFVADPFSPLPNARLYRTGDLARWLPDGNVEFLGRIDDQVKIRGFRIELGEIEAALGDLEGVGQAAVVTQADSSGNDQLIAHVVAEGTVGVIEPDDLRDQLEQRLPGYMVPVGIGFVDALPMTPSGKIDRAALPSIELGETAKAKVAPRTPLERRLAEIWSEVLGSSDIGVHDNFFDIGGNSLSAIRLFSAIRELTGERMKLPELFAAPSIAELAAVLGESENDGSFDDQTSAAGGAPSWVFPVKASGSRPPLFHLGGASVLRRLSTYLPDEQPLYALLEQDLSADHFYTSVAEIVPHCIEGIRAVQPKGPYLIAGLCFGGVVALEMSRQLQAAGDEVALTVMIDSFAPGAIQAANTERQLADAAAAEVPQPSGRADAQQSPSRIELLKATYHPTRVVRKTRKHLWRASWGPIHGLHRRVGRPMPSWLRDVEEANTIAADAYEASFYDGDVTLFRATENSDDLDGGPENGWGPLIGGTLTIEDVIGGHISMYEEPKVAGLAEALNRALESVTVREGKRHA